MVCKTANVVVGCKAAAALKLAGAGALSAYDRCCTVISGSSLLQLKIRSSHPKLAVRPVAGVHEARAVHASNTPDSTLPRDPKLLRHADRAANPPAPSHCPAAAACQQLPPQLPEHVATHSCVSVNLQTCVGWL